MFYYCCWLQCDIPLTSSKTVPKSFYQYTTEEIEQEQEKSSDNPNLFGKSAYQTAYVAKDFPHEVGILLIEWKNDKY